MKLFTAFLAVLALGLSLALTPAEAAKRVGGGQSSGMQRQASPQSPAASPNAAGKPAAAPAAQPRRSWMGPIAGLAAGLGLAALASYMGFGEELANAMMIALMVMVVLAVIGFIMKRRSAQNSRGAMQFAGAPAGQGSGAGYQVQMPGGGTAAGAAPMAGAVAADSVSSIPADFDKSGFERNAKVNFIRLQAANDAGDVADLRNFTTPEMFAELKMQLSERGQSAQKTDVLSLNADVIDVAQEADRYVVSVRFNAMIREEANAPAESVDEIWHMVKPRDGTSGWLLAGIQQTH